MILVTLNLLLTSHLDNVAASWLRIRSSKVFFFSGLKHIPFTTLDLVCNLQSKYFVLPEFFYW